MKRPDIKVNGVYRGCNGKTVIVTDMYQPQDGRKDLIVEYQIIKMKHHRGTSHRVGDKREMQIGTFVSWAIRSIGDISLKDLNLWE